MLKHDEIINKLDFYERCKLLCNLHLLKNLFAFDW